MKGYTGKMLEVDAGTKEFKVKEIPHEIYQKYLGGLGLCVWYMSENFKHGTDAFHPDNLLIMAGGLFSGYPVPSGGKTIFLSRSPLTGTIAESVMGGYIGAQLKFAGYDLLAIKGKAEKPSFIYIYNDEFAVQDAKHLWGKTTRETAKELKKDFKNYAVAVIGPGGEKLVRYACIDCEDRQAGRAGLGAVMGSKNIKAIVINGTGYLEPHDPEKLKALQERFLNMTIKDANYEADTKYGTGEFLEWMNAERGTFPTKNWQKGVFNERNEIDPYYWAPKYSEKNKGCLACMKPCGKLFKIKNGKYAGTVVDGVEYETLYSLGGVVCNPSIEAVAKANELCDLYGIDTISTGVCIAFAMECFEKGIINENDTGGLNLNFGNPEVVVRMVRMIGERDGIGKVLGEGVKRAAEKIGKGSEEFAIHVKGMEPPAYDVRGIKGMGLAFMVSSRGACHLRSGAYALELVGRFWKFSGVDRLSSKNKGQEIKDMEDFMAIYDSVGMCKFSRGLFLLENFKDVIKAINGMTLEESDLLIIGERINNLKRLFNIREGFGRKDDSLPKRIMSLPIPEGISKGSYIKPEEAEEMLNDYYTARGWDEEGRPKPEKLEYLGIKG